MARGPHRTTRDESSTIHKAAILAVGWNATTYDHALRDEFDQLYEEGLQRRRIIVISLHDRSPGMQALSAASSQMIPEDFMAEKY
jgi:hypothetical protein